MAIFDQVLTEASTAPAPVSATELVRHPRDGRHFYVDQAQDLVRLCELAKAKGFWLIALFGCDERPLEDEAFKVYCILSGRPVSRSGPEAACPCASDELIILEHPLAAGVPTWRSIAKAFKAAEPLELELADLFGIRIERPPAPSPEPGEPPRPVLLGAYPARFHPLRRDSFPAVHERAAPEEVEQLGEVPLPPAPDPKRPEEGVMIVPVGPIHAGVIQPGYFAFHVAGEVVEELPVQLGFTHRGVERLFERRSLMDGWELAGRVAGDSAFAHSLAYCHAVESLAGVPCDPRAPGAIPEAARLWRGLLLELERLCNHLADCAAIVHDMAFDALSSPMTAIQEDLVRLAAELTGDRLLGGVNRPGGVLLPTAALARRLIEAPGVPGAEGSRRVRWYRRWTSDRRSASKPGPSLAAEVSALVGDFLDLARPVMESSLCRDRLISTGVLTRAEAASLGAAGLPARASGLADRDFRLRHARGLYGSDDLDARVRDEIEQTIPRPGAEDWTRRVPVRWGSDLTGDVFARTLLRLAEAETSGRIIRLLAERLAVLGPAAPLCADLREPLRRAHNFDFGIGFAEGWRGEVCYWLMKGPHGGIYRCKVRDPSVFNWPALAKAVERKERNPGEPGSGGFHENILADFPLINKSFNLSYAGTDL